MSERVSLLEGLFEEQTRTWPLLGNGVAAVARAHTRSVLVKGNEVLVRHIPHRVASTTAPVDRESIKKRPCFLCPQNLFPEQKGLAFGPDYTIYCNPFPIVERHVTIVNREHRPQRIEGQIEMMLDFAEAFPGYFVIYNGPRCGASAPDHLHLQAGLMKGLPIGRDTRCQDGPVFEGYGARALFFRGDRRHARENVNRALSILARETAGEPEPWCNVAVFAGGTGNLTVVLFPRGKHRPNVFLTGELTVSPAAIDMCGILVAPLSSDFEKITGEAVESIFEEVSLEEALFCRVVSQLGRL